MSRWSKGNWGSKSDTDYATTVAGECDDDDAATFKTHQDTATVICSTTTVDDKMGVDSGAESFDSAKDTSVGSKSSQRTTSCRPANQRGPARRRKQTARTEERMAKKKGADFVPKELLYAPILENDSMITGQTPNEKREIVKTIVKRASDEKIEDYPLLKFTEMPEWYTPKPLTEEIKDKVARITAHMVAKQWCSICGSPVWSHDDSHLAGRNHLLRIGIMAKLDALMGPPKAGAGSRPYGQGYPTPSSGIVEYEQIRDFWGEGLDFFSRSANKIMDQGIWIKSRKNRPRTLLPPRHVMAAALALINYEGAGAGVYSSRHNLKWSFSFPFKTTAGEQWWPILILSLSKQAQVEHQVEFDHEVELDHEVVQKDGGDGGDWEDPCKTGEVYVSATDAEGLRRLSPTDATDFRGMIDGWGDSRGLWAICAYQATDEPPSGWPLRVRFG